MPDPGGAVEDLAQINNHLLDAIECLSDGLIIFDGNQNVVACNARYHEIFNVVPGVVEPGAGFEQLVRTQVAEGQYALADTDKDDWVAARLSDYSEFGQANEVELSDGRWVRTHRFATKSSGVVEIHSDISATQNGDSAIRESEALFRAMLDHIPALISLKDIDGRYLIANKGFEEMVGITSSAAVNKTTHDLGMDNTAADLISELDRKVIEAGAVISQERHVVTMTGPQDRDMTKFPVYDSEGNLVGVGTFSIDISNRKAVESQLRQSQKMEAVGQLTGGVAHDFNNILSVILGNLGLIEDEIGEIAAIKPLLDAAIAATDSGADLNRQLLAFSRQTPLAPISIDLNKQVSGMTSMLRRVLEESIEIELVRGAGLWACEADPGQIENAVLNLAINARDAMADGGKLTIETANARLDDEYAAAQAEVVPGQYVMVAITDTGAGMAPEVIDKAFDPFFTTKEIGKGTGMGLSMVFGFVKQSNGHIKIYSELGQGTTIKIYLPRTRREPGAVQSQPRLAVPLARGETVLVVEDDANLRTLVMKLVRDLGYRVLEARDGDTAIERMQANNSINLLLTDVVLPGGKGGAEVAREARQIHPGIKVLFMSGYTENAIIHHGRLDDGVHLLEKPFRKAELARKLRDALEAE